MTTRSSLRLARIASLIPFVLAAGSAFAADADADWQRFGRDIDANIFIVGHPASPRWRVVHANDEHPAVVVARQAREARIDPNTFIVQPPAGVTWREHGDDTAQAVASGR